MPTTRSSTNKEENLTYATEKALTQLKEEVGKVCDANRGTEKQLRSLASRLDNIMVRSCSSVCMHSISQQCVQVATKELKELEEVVQKGFASLGARINHREDEINCSMLDWQKTFGLSTSDPRYSTCPDDSQNKA